MFWGQPGIDQTDCVWFCSIGQDKISIGQDGFSIGQEGFSILQDKFSIGQHGVSIGQDKFSIGQDKFSIGQDEFSIGQDKFSIGQDEFFLVRRPKEVLSQVRSDGLTECLSESDTFWCKFSTELQSAMNTIASMQQSP